MATVVDGVPAQTRKARLNAYCQCSPEQRVGSGVIYVTENKLVAGKRRQVRGGRVGAIETELFVDVRGKTRK